MEIAAKGNWPGSDVTFLQGRSGDGAFPGTRRMLAVVSLSAR